MNEQKEEYAGDVILTPEITYPCRVAPAPAWGFLSGNVLKWISMLVMVIDHIGAALLERMLSYSLEGGNLQALMMEKAPALYFSWMGNWESLYAVDLVLRKIGRLSFPVFCFLLVEGFVHTRNPVKYGIRLFLFGILSEIPFDMAFFGNVAICGGLVYPKYQNVMFTLLLGLIALMGLELPETILKLKRQKAAIYAGSAGMRGEEARAFVLREVPDMPPEFEKKVRWIGRLLAVLCVIASYCFHTDYAGMGVLFILVLYLAGKNRILQAAAGAMVFLADPPIPYSSLAVILFLCYSGKRGKSLLGKADKYFFYGFYAAHLLLLGLFARYLGI